MSDTLPIWLCSVCGTALGATGGCEACGTMRGSPKPAPATELRVVAVRCTFPCRACGFDSPLDVLSGDGGAHCLKCGLHQTFPVEAWNVALSRLHAIADLAGPDPEGAERDAVWSIVPSGLAHLRVSQAVVPIHEGLLTATAGPGHPLCEACGCPVDIVVDDVGLLSTTCPGCQATASYACQTDALGVPVLGAIGPEHRIDRLDATRTSDQFHCGSCGAPLPVDGLGRLVACPYCQAVSRIPVQQLQGLSAPPPPDVWFLVFQGPSERRRQLLREKAGPDGDVALESPPRGGSRVGYRALHLGGTAFAMATGSLLALAGWGVWFAGLHL